MQAPWNRAAKIALAASFAAMALTGCKRPVEQADDAVHEQLAAANQQLDTAPQDPATAVSYFQKAATATGTSDDAKLQSHMALADIDQRAADDLIRKIEGRQAKIVALTQMINRQVNRIQDNNIQIASLKALDPSATQDALTKLQAAATGSTDNADWIKSDNGTAIPSSTGIKAKIKELKDNLDKLTTQKNNLQTQRAQLLQQAEQLNTQSDAAKGKQSVDLFTQGADLTKQAAQLNIQSEGRDVKIAEVQQDLALATATDKQIDAALDALSKQGDQIKAGWVEMQKVIQDCSDRNAALVSPSAPAADASAAPADATAPPTTAPSAGNLPTTIADAAATIDKLRTDNDASRGAAEKYLNDAIDAFKAADTARAQLVRTYTSILAQPSTKDFPQREAWQGLIDVNNASDVKLSMAMADLRLARLYADWATTISARAQSAKLLQVVATAGALTVPDSMKPEAAGANLDSASGKANKAFSDADQLLTDLQRPSSSAPVTKSAQSAAQAVQVIELYAHAKFAEAMGDAKNAAELLKQSKEAVASAVSLNVQLSTLPPEIAIATAAAAPPATGATAPVPAAPVPAAGPAAAPATTPAGPASIITTPQAPDATPAPAAPAGTPATPAPGAPAPVTPAPGTPAPATPAPGTPAPAAPAPGTPAPATPPQ